MDNRQDRLLPIDGLRGIAAIAVAAYDFSAVVGLRQGSAGFFGHGYLAADFFFCLSGFMLARAYTDRIATGALTLKAFAVARFARLLPLMALVAIAAFVLRMIFWNAGGSSDGDTAAQLLTDLPFAMLTLPQNVHTDPAGTFFPFNASGWFIFAEIVLNLVWAASLARARIEIVLIAAAAAFAILVPHVLHANTLNFSMTRAVGLWLPLARGTLSFLLGVALWRLSLGKVDEVFQFEILATVLCGVLCLPAGPSWVYDLVCVTLLFPMMILFAAEAETIVTGRRVLIFLGAIAFPLFAIHQPLLMLLTKLAPSHPALLSPVSMPLELALGIAFAWGVHAYIDVPLRVWVSRATRSDIKRGRQ